MVVGQMLEYAANGQHYWSIAAIRKLAEETAKQQGTTPEECLEKLQLEIAASADDFFQEVERRLRAGQIRLIFFLDQAPDELKSLVEFLNKQMNLSEVLLVEARQYRSTGARIVVPRLFGYSEQARQVRRVIATRGPVATDWEAFASNAATKGLDTATIEALKVLYDACKELKADIAWGRGTVTGSFSPKWKSLGTIAPFSIYATGLLELHLSSFRSSERAIAFRERFAASLGKAIKLRSDHMTAWYSHQAPEWSSKVQDVINALKFALDEQPLSTAASAS
jgi:hypothetical protein